jgi:hypothetical protein
LLIGIAKQNWRSHSSVWNCFDQMGNRNAAGSSLMADFEGRIIFPGVEDRTTVDEVGERSVTSTVGHDEHAVWSIVH